MIEKLNSLKVPFDEIDARRHTKNPRTYGVMRGFLTPESSDSPADVARRFLRVNDEELGAVFTKGALSLDADRGQLAVDREFGSPAGYHVRFEQKHEGVPIVGAGASVHMTAKREIHYATDDREYDIPPMHVEHAKEAGLPRPEAIRKAVAHVDGQHRLRRAPSAELAIWRDDGRHYLAWKVSVGVNAVKPLILTENRAASWQVFVDVASGDVLSCTDVLSRATGTGRVFYPNPVVTLRTYNLTVDTHFADYAYRHVSLPRLRKSGYLTGKYVTTRLTPAPRARNQDLEFHFDSHDPRFEEVMVYYWIDRVCAYLHQLGFRGVMKSPLPVNARGTEDDQSWYDPQARELNFGLGGVNDAEDADIILHEFGHAFLDALVPRWGNAWYADPVRSMGEGVGDFLACCYLADADGNFQPAVVADWDAFGYDRYGNPPMLRRVDGSKTLQNVVGRGTSTALGTLTLSDNSAHWVPGALVGLRVTPDVYREPRPNYFVISENTATSLTVDSLFGYGLTDFGQVGDRYAGEEHEDGEFWAAVLWDIYLAFGGDSDAAADRLEAADKALQLVLLAHSYLDDQSRETIEFTDAGEALLEADRYAWGEPIDPGPNEAQLLSVLQKRGLQ